MAGEANGVAPPAAPAVAEGDEGLVPPEVQGGDGPPLMRAPPVKAMQAKRDPASGKFLRRGGGTTEVEADAEQEEAKPAAPQRFKRKLKINGKEEEHEAGEDELWAAYREKSAAKSRFEEAAKLRKEADDATKRNGELEERLKKSPMKVLMEKGYSAEAALDILQQEFETLLAEESKSPAQRELDGLRKEKADRARADQDRAKQATSQQEEAAFQKEVDDDSVLIGEALKLSKLPKDDLTFETMAKAYYANKRNGIGLTQAELAAATTKQIGSHIDGVLAGMESDDEVLDAFPRATKRIVAALKKRYAKQQAGGNVVRPRAPAPAKPPDGPRVMTDRQLDEAFGIRRRQG